MWNRQEVKSSEEVKVVQSVQKCPFAPQDLATLKDRIGESQAPSSDHRPRGFWIHQIPASLGQTTRASSGQDVSFVSISARRTFASHHWSLAMAANTLVRIFVLFITLNTSRTDKKQLDRLVGLAMLVVASTVFLYYTIWTLLMVWQIHNTITKGLHKA